MILRESHLQLHHIKPHGALYNLAARDCNTADIIIEVMKGIPMPLKLYVPYGSVIAERAVEQGISITYEAFADRNYNDDLSLVSRTDPKALINEPAEVCDHVLRMINDGMVKTIDGHLVPIKAETFCVHGDNPDALKILQMLKEQLENHSIKIL